MRTPNQGKWRLLVESVSLGLGYAAVLIWSGAALVAAFSGGEAGPYWPAIPQLRTDTTGVMAFGVATVSLALSKYLQLRRTNGVKVQPTARTPGAHAAQAVAETLVVLATGLVIYLSLNAVTHPITLRIQLTHLWPWPSEGTVRVIALGVCLVAMATRRYLRATSGRPGNPAAGEASSAQERADIAV